MVNPAFSRGKVLNLIGLGIIVYLGVIVFQTVRHNYQLSNQITDLQNKITDLTNQQAQLKYDVAYYQTNAFKEKAARSNLGLMQPGEGVIVLPKAPTPAPLQAPTKKTAPIRHKSNLAQWWDFLFG